MARTIEPGSVLSQEDYDYLVTRCRLDEALNVWGCTLGEGVGDDPAPTPPQLFEPVHPEQTAFIDGTEDAGVAVYEATEDDEDDEVPPYEEWKVADLEAEIDRRNEGRDEDDLIVPEGSGKDGNVVKADLITALDADDANEADVADEE